MVSAGRSWGDVEHVHSQEEGTGSIRKTYQLRTRGAGAGERRPFLEDLMDVSTRGISRQIKPNF